MVQKKKKKKYKLNPRFYVWIISLGIVTCATFQMVRVFQNNAVPNFHGWSAEKVMEYDAAHKEINVTYELVYSYDVLHNRVLSQSVKPSTKYKKEPTTVHIQVSKGYPVMADFTGKSMDELLAFAKAYDIKVIQHVAAMVEPEKNSMDSPVSEEEPINSSELDEDMTNNESTDGQEQPDESLPLSEGDEADDEMVNENMGDTSENEEEQHVKDQTETESGNVEKQRKVISQSIPPGSTILKGSEIEITFSLE